MPELNSLQQLGEGLGGGPDGTIWLAERLLRIRDRDGTLKPLVANEAQRRFERDRGRENIILKARQMGMTTWIAARFFLRTITAPGTVCLHVAHTREAAEALFTTVHRLWEHLPRELREGALRRKRATQNLIVLGAIDSELRIASAAEPNAGRGLRVNLLHLSELSRWPGDAQETLAGLRASLVPTGELVMESTPNGAYGAFHDQWLAACDPAHAKAHPGTVIRHFLPWWLEGSYRSLEVPPAAMSDEELQLAALHGLTPAQIGFRRGLERSFGGLRVQEFAEDPAACFRSSGACCFDLEPLAAQLAAGGVPVRDTRLNGALEIYLPPALGRDYVVAADPAGGGAEGDFAAIEVIDRLTGLQCAELRGHLRPEALAREAAALAREYNGALLAVERNNHGAAVLAFLQTTERYSRLYAERGEPGWLTTSASRPDALARLNVLLRESPGLFFSHRLLAECRSFITTGQGRQEAAAGAHDDLVLAMAIAHGVRERMLNASA